MSGSAKVILLSAPKSDTPLTSVALPAMRRREEGENRPTRAVLRSG